MNNGSFAMEIVSNACACGKRTDHWSGKCANCRRSQCAKCGKTVRFADAAKKLCNVCTYIVSKPAARRRGALVEV